MTKRTAFLAILVVAILVGLWSPAFADVVATATIDVNINVDAVAAIVVSGAAATFTVGGTPAAGALPTIDDTGNTPTYLQYTSIVPATETRTIAVQADVAAPAGLILNIRAGTPTGNGGVGTPIAGGVNISSAYVATTDLTIVDAITSCATGAGVTQGAPVYYTLTIDEATFADLDTNLAAYVMTLTYTLVGS